MCRKKSTSGYRYTLHAPTSDHMLIPSIEEVILIPKGILIKYTIFCGIRKVCNHTFEMNILTHPSLILQEARATGHLSFGNWKTAKQQLVLRSIYIFISLDRSTVWSLRLRTLVDTRYCSSVVCGLDKVKSRGKRSHNNDSRHSLVFSRNDHHRFCCFLQNVLACAGACACPGTFRNIYF